MNPTAALLGLHHLTAIASDPQRNVDFYTGVLGLRLVKKTVNFDDPSAYHLYYGDESGTPGSALTFFYWPDFTGRGRLGAGQATRISLSVAPGSFTYWRSRLAAAGVAVDETTRFGEEVLRFLDPDGIPVELVAVAQDARTGWSGGGVPAAYAIRGMHLAEISVGSLAATEALLTGVLGFVRVRQEGVRVRFALGAGQSGALLDVLEVSAGPRGAGGAGTIHHLAWRVADDPTELAFQRRLAGAGVGVSPVRDRNYFHSIYFREPSGVLFEIATDTPGFTVDEPLGSLGQALKLPAEFERQRAAIEAALPTLRVGATEATRSSSV